MTTMGLLIAKCCPVRPWWTAALALFLCTVASHPGCKSTPKPEVGPPVSRYQAPQLPSVEARRVVLLPLTNMTQYNHVGHEFDKLLAAELRTKGIFDLIVLSHAEVPEANHHLANGSLFDDQMLAFLGRKYRADAVIMGRIGHYHPYWPPSISVSLHCVGTRDATVLASVDGNWDARNEFTARQTQQFYSYLHPHTQLPHSELVLHSPSYFQKFVAYQITERFFNSSAGFFAAEVINE